MNIFNRKKNDWKIIISDKQNLSTKLDLIITGKTILEGATIFSKSNCLPNHYQKVCEGKNTEYLILLTFEEPFSEDNVRQSSWKVKF